MRFPFTGVIPIDKPAGVSSRRVVDAVAAALGSRAVGHAGTLDPQAEGVVVVCVGHATRLVDCIHMLPKRYAATFLLGRSSPSDDLETPVVEEAAPLQPTRGAVEDALSGFRGEILQRPCAYSAVHVGGRRAYRLARQGAAVDLPARPVRIDAIEVGAYAWPRLSLAIACSTGTFVRALGRDVAAALGTTAVMEALVREAVGPFRRVDALPLAAVDPATARESILPAARAVAHLPAATLPDDLLARAVRGGILADDETGGAGSADAAVVAAFDAAGELVGLLARLPDGGRRLRPNFRGVG